MKNDKHIFLNDAELEKASYCLKIIAHPIRLKLIEKMLLERLSVGELAEYCGLKDNVASEHLRLMRHCGLVAPEKDGKVAYYRVVEPHLKDIIKCVRNRFSGKGSL